MIEDVWWKPENMNQDSSSDDDMPSSDEDMLSSDDDEQIHDGVFLTYNLMTQLLRRGSFQATEMEVYKLAKTYVQTVIDIEKQEYPQFDMQQPYVPKIVELAVNFDEMTLNAIHEVVEDEWLSEKFRLEIAKKAIGRNKQILQTEKRRNGERMVVAEITALVSGGYRKKNVEKLEGNKIQFTSSENVLLHIGSNSILSRLEFSQEGGLKDVLLKNSGFPTSGGYHGNQYIYVRKAKLATVKLTENDGIRRKEEKYRYDDIHRNDFKIIFEPNILSNGHGLKLSFCPVYDDLFKFEQKE